MSDWNASSSFVFRGNKTCCGSSKMRVWVDRFFGLGMMQLYPLAFSTDRVLEDCPNLM
jgi:hypothetical protein